MSLSEAQERLVDVSRGELKLAAWSDATVIDQLNKVLGKFGLEGEDATVIEAVLERFNWLAALAEVNGYGTVPMLFADGGSRINLDFVQWLAKSRNIDIVQAAKETIVFASQRFEFMAEKIDELRVIAATERYEPAVDEPSIFDGERASPGTDWMLWYSRYADVSLIAAHEAGQKVINQLLNELPRTINRAEGDPTMFVRSKELERAGVKHRALSLSWVIWAKYARDLDWYETHYDGLIMLRKST